MDAAFGAGVAYAIYCFGAFSSTWLSNSSFLHKALTSKGKTELLNSAHLTIVSQEKKRKQGEQNETKCAH
jgi:hypothetical protein